MAVHTTFDDTAVAPVERRTVSRGHLAGSERLWALAFVTPYVAVFLAFVVYPICYGLWLGSSPASYAQLFAEKNTLIYLLIAVNLKLFLALLLSGFFMRKGWLNRIVLLIFLLPWAVPGIPSYISIHWMLNGQWGLVNKLTATGEALAGAQALAAEISVNGPLAVAMTKRVMTEAPGWPAAEVWSRQRELLEIVIASNDAREGAQAFADKRPPLWSGS